MNLSMLTPAQAAATGRFLDAERGKRRHLVVYVSGAHAYGFPSPDSDVDVKCIHIAPTRDLVGLHVRDGAAERIEWVDGVEVDYGSNELGPVLAAVLKGNGNYLERILGDLVIEADPVLDGLRPLARRTLSRRLFRHYAGFAGSQRRNVDEVAAPTAKKVLYVLRTALTGAHLLATGELVTDLTRLIDEYGFTEARELIAIKLAGERVTLDDDAVARWRREVGRALDALEAARDRSVLPDEPTAADAAALEAWLIETRRASW